MKKFLVLISLFSFSLIFAQGVDIPDFVVSGTENVTLPIIKKKKPEPLLPLGNDFFLHKFSPEDFSVSYIVDSDTNYILPFKRSKSFKQYAKITSGFNTLPEAKVFWGFPLENGYLSLGFGGKNQLNYIPYAGRTDLNGNVHLKLFTNYNSGKLPASQFDIFTQGYYQDFRFFGSDNPSLRRKVSFGTAGVTFKHYSDENFNVVAGVFGEDFRMVKENFTEQNVRGFIQLKKRFTSFNLIGKGNFVNQKIKHSNYLVYNFVNFIVAGELSPYKSFSMQIGAHFAHSGGRNSFAPYLKGKVKLVDNLVFVGSWSSNSKFITSSDLQRENPYFVLGTSNVFTTLYNKIDFAFYYSLLNFLDASIDFGFQKTDGFLYFESVSGKTGFVPKTMDAVNGFIANLNVNFYIDRFGYFSGRLNINREVDKNNKLLPYSPIFRGKFFYTYKAPFDLTLSFGSIYYSRAYINLANSSSVPPYINLFASGNYKLLKNLKLVLSINNILNKDNFRFRGYKELPMDIQLGIEYFWR